MPINNRGLSGQSVLPYVDFRAYAGTDVFLDLTFLDHTGKGNIPQSASYQVDDLTNAVNMIPQTNIPIQGYQQTLQIPASSLVMTHQWQGSQMCQVWIQALMSDGSHVNGITVVELVSIQTPNNGS